MRQNEVANLNFRRELHLPDDKDDIAMKPGVVHRSPGNTLGGAGLFWNRVKQLEFVL